VQVGVEGTGGDRQPWPGSRCARGRAAQVPMGKWQATW
jgi:hypothetical protein